VKSRKSKNINRYLDAVNYSHDPNYVPSEFSLKMVNFIKMVNADRGGEEHKTPVMHMKMLDTLSKKGSNRIANMCSRGSAKTTLMGEYLILYMAVYGSLDNFGDVDLVMYVSDSVENGVKNMRKNLEHRWNNSEFLQTYLPPNKVRFTDVRWEFGNLSGHSLVVKGYGALTGIRGVKEMGKRPQIAILDDLISDTDARSPTVIGSVEDTVYKAVTYALHPSNNKIIWSGTPFNARDPLYKAVVSDAWESNVFPICEKFPCTWAEFRGAWEDRFNYEYVKQQYDTAIALGKQDTFDQELMLRIMSDDDRLIPDEFINWFSLKLLKKNISLFDIYITTDFATSAKQSADFSVISVWAHNYNRDWFWIDGVVKKQGMGDNIDALFRLVAKYKPLKVGIEISGQQGGFIPWIKGEMIRRNCFFNIGKDKVDGRSEEGFRPTTDKFSRLEICLPWIKQGHLYLPEEYRDSDPRIEEALDELELVSPNGFRSLHDDWLDSLSMIPRLQAVRPSQRVNLDKSSVDTIEGGDRYSDVSLWELENDDDNENSEVSGFSSYMV
jgi:hypothetical protein